MLKLRTDNTFTTEEVAQIRAKVRGLMQSEGLSQAAIARDSGVAYGTFTAWLGGSYQGNNDKVAGEVQIWLSAREENKRTRAYVPAIPGFQRTPSADAFLDTLRFAQVMPEISVIAGGAGIGKTSAINHYAATNPNVWVATMDPSMARIHGMLKELCAVMDVTEKSATELPRAIGRKVAGTGGLLIIDEAQHLAPPSLDQLRSIYDRHGIGIALVGNETLYSHLEGEGKKASFAQLFSRIGMRVTQARPRAEDICALIKAWEVSDSEEVKFLKAIGRRPGALRIMTKCLQLASLLAAGANEARTLQHIRAAWTKLSSLPQAA